MKKRNLFMVMAGVVLLLAFSPAGNGESRIYGTCGDAAMVELKLEANGTFSYRDHSDPLHVIDAAGTWTQKKQTVLLSVQKGSQKFHSKWHLSDEGRVAKSRLGMAFYRLVRTDCCE